eukprot:gnl/MRDRNA2_/MRDRNA2_31830_c0_seq1.p1 gnl/MRDRNA2_/MRDRNA2_31830_c0~~gnl/MRDRNA2_/MRDRNA2_31830_c0_seq1.p1  ORF type:complete len:314 (-),score=26.06 gnl/MRDRNA2_/MRDRNA2_31830_c0_seq1:49-990(-)
MVTFAVWVARSLVFISASCASQQQSGMLPAEIGENSNITIKIAALDSTNLYQYGGCLGCCVQGTCSAAFHGDYGYCCGRVDSVPYCCPDEANAQYGRAQCVRRDGYKCYRSPSSPAPPPPPTPSPPHYHAPSPSRQHTPSPPPSASPSSKKSWRDTCSKDTGGTCHVMGCSSSRGPTQCIDGECQCQSGYCALGGSCIRDCEKDTGGTCHIWGCSGDRGPTTCSSGHCLCAKGYCAVNGNCYHPSQTESDIIYQNVTFSVESKRIDFIDYNVNTVTVVALVAFTSTSAFACKMLSRRRGSWVRFFRAPLLDDS